MGETNGKNWERRTRSWRSLLLQIGDKCSDYGGNADVKDHIVLTNLCVREQYHTFAIDEDFYQMIGKDGEEREYVILLACFDVSDDGVSGLAHLTSLKFLTLRLVPGFKYSEGLMTMRIWVEVMKDAFDTCDLLLLTGICGSYLPSISST
ncbi:hypothetical protein LINPERHAP1_LOCUS11328 [Linum perenne]